MKARHAAPSRHRRTKRGAIALGAGLLALTVAGTASAKELASGGGGGGGTAACNPVASFGVRADARAGETGLATIDVDYTVKPCVRDQVVTVRTRVAETLAPSVVVWDDPAAPLSGRFTVAGVRVRVSYKVTVDVFDAATGALAGTRSLTTAAIPKGV